LSTLAEKSAETDRGRVREPNNNETCEHSKSRLNDPNENGTSEISLRNKNSKARNSNIMYEHSTSNKIRDQSIGNGATEILFTIDLMNLV